MALSRCVSTPHGEFKARLIGGSLAWYTYCLVLFIKWKHNPCRNPRTPSLGHTHARIKKRLAFEFHPVGPLLSVPRLGVKASMEMEASKQGDRRAAHRGSRGCYGHGSGPFCLITVGIRRIRRRQRPTESPKLASETEVRAKTDPQIYSNRYTDVGIFRRIWITASTTIATMIVTGASAIFATAIPSVMRKYDVSREIALLGVSLYVLGFAFGPIVWAPLSELRGRYLPLVTSLTGFVVFSFATGASNNIASILVFRFLGGFFGSGPLTLAGPLYADIFVGRAFGISMVCFAFVVFRGPILSQPIGGFIVINQSLGWRWTEYICGILGAAALVVIILVLKETYAPVILARKARQLRKLNGDVLIIARHETIHLTWKVLLVDYLAFPLKMLVSDPIVLLMSLFGSFVYAILYLLLVGYPIVFQKIHGMKPGIGGLPFLGLVAGEICTVAAIFGMQPWIMRKAQLNGGKVMPEWQLPIAVPGAAAFSLGILWFGWSGYRREIHWIVPTLSGWLSGFGLLATFMPSISYLAQARPERCVECPSRSRLDLDDVLNKPELSRPASAIAAHTILRSLAASAFPMFATFMYNSIGVQWASTLLGCLAALMIPIPVLLYIYGPRIRTRGEVVFS